MNQPRSNLPNQTIDSANKVKEFYNRYYRLNLSYPASEIDAVVGFFVKRDFAEEASRSIAGVLVQQSKVDDVDVFKLLDTLKGLNKVQLSSIVTEILNYNRPKSSTLGFKVDGDVQWTEKRNIMV